MIRVSAVEGNRQWLDGGAMFGNAPRPVWEKWIAPDPLGRIPLACRAMFLEVNGVKILCEAGIGAFFEPKLAERYGVESPDRHRLLESLKALDVREGDVDFVILSHLHFDHAGGLLPTYAEMQRGKTDLLFPNAKYIVGQEAWSRALEPHSRDRASFVPELNEKLKSSGRLIVVTGESHPDVLPDNIRFRYSNGHTPGQMHTVCRGDKRSVFFAGDLIPGMPWVHLPITMGYDRYPELLIDEKARLYQDAVAEDWWVFFTHDPQTAMAHVRQNAKGRFEPFEPQTQVAHFTI